MKTQEEIQNDVTILANEVNENLTEGMVRHGQSYSSCFPSETSYCSGVESALESILEKIFEKYILTEK